MMREKGPAMGTPAYVGTVPSHPTRLAYSTAIAIALFSTGLYSSAPLSPRVHG